MNILFVCTGNTCRSPMAKIIFEDMIKKSDNINCYSAGLLCADGAEISKNAAKVLKEINLNGEEHKSKNVLSLLKELDFDKFVVMTKNHASVLKDLQIPDEKTCVLGCGIDDPYGMGENKYREVRDQIKEALKVLYKEILYNKSKTNE